MCFWQKRNDCSESEGAAFIQCLFEQRRRSEMTQLLLSHKMQSYARGMMPPRLVLASYVHLEYWLIFTRMSVGKRLNKKHMLSFNLHTLLPVVTVRDAKHTNFVEFRNFKIVYRRYEIILDNGNAQ